MSAVHEPVIPSELFAGKRILLSGTTGFLGKVVLSLLLTRSPRIGQIYTLIRPGPSDRAQDRFDKTVATSPALGPVIETHGAQLLKDKVVPIDGNIVKDDCGIAPEVLAELERDGLDLIIN